MFDTGVVYDNETTALVGVPTNLEDIPPGYVLAAVLDDIDINTCSGYDRVRVLQAHQRMRSHYAARSYLTMTKVLDAIDQDDMAADMVEQAAASEVAAALRLTRSGRRYRNDTRFRATTPATRSLGSATRWAS